MATVATPAPSKTTSHFGGDIGFPRAGHFGSDGPSKYEPLPERRYYTGMLMGLAGIFMLFAALTSALVVRKGISDDWIALTFPTILWPNTLILLASSFTMEKARWSLASTTQFRRWWGATVILGICFLLGQILAWQQLALQGVYLSTNPSSSFFYVLTGSHGVHLLGGVVALLYLSWKMWRHPAAPSKTMVDVAGIYWHFMDGLWVYVFLLLLLWR